MSASGDDVELKGGHPPAVKAGGMRVARHRTSSNNSESKDAAQAAEDVKEFGEDPKVDTHKQKVLVGGAVGKGDADFTPAAVQKYHDKPKPTLDQRPVSKPHNINQPR